MNSPDSFERRIEQAARELRRPAPEGLLDRVRARAADLDASIETAARALAGPAPLDALDVRIAAAARALRRPAPAGLLERALAVARRPRLIVLRAAAALAAALLLAAAIWLRLDDEAAADGSPALLTSAALAQSLSDEARLGREALRLERRVSDDATLSDDETAQSLLEEVAFLDQAIEECRRALALSPAHGHLRERLVELSGRRVDLLRWVADGGGEAGGPRG